MGISILREIIQCFKKECESKGWKASEHEDWVKIDNEYHNFLWIRTIHPSSLKQIAEAHKCAIKEGISYRVVDITYTALLLTDPPTDQLIQVIVENPAIAKKTAIYDLSCGHLDKTTCLKLNKTDSKVFLEFESFLQKKLGVDCRPIPEALTKML